MAFPLTDEQIAAANARGREILVSAAAGSGKTRVLVERLIGMICDEKDPRDIDEFLLLTFTNATAAEMRSRVSAGLSERLAADPGNRRLRRQLMLIDRAQITTIHSFCLSLVRENAYAIGISPDFRLMDEAEADILKERAMERVLEKAYEDRGEGFVLLAESLVSGIDDRKLKNTLLDLCNALDSHAFPDEWMRKIESEFGVGDIDFTETVWGRVVVDSFRSEAEHARYTVEAALEKASAYEILKNAYGPTLEKDLEGIDVFLKALDGNWDGIVAAAKAVTFARLGSSRGFEDKELTGWISSVRKSWKDSHGKILKICDSSNLDFHSDLEALSPVVKALFGLARDFIREYGVLKNSRNCCDFADIEHFAVTLLTKSGEDGCLEPTDLAREVSERYKEILVDEYQDINPVQNAILDSISKKPGNLFLVGDVKQSIYRFRLAEPGIFLDKYTSYADYDKAEGEEGAKLIMSRNFRSRGAVLDAVNYVFERIMFKESGGLDYGERERLNMGATFEGEDEPVELHLISNENEEEGDEESLGRVELEAEYVAERIIELLNSGMPVSDGAGGRRPVRLGDIVLLLRSASSAAPVFERALEARGIMTDSDRDDDMLGESEIMALSSILEIIDNYKQDVPLISAMRSPIFAFSEDELAAIRENHKDCPFHEAVELEAEGGNERCRRLLETVNELRFLAPDMPVHRLIWHILVNMDMLPMYGAMADGERKKKNLLNFYSMAKRFESSGFRGLFSFVAFLRRMYERGGSLKAEGDAVDGGDAVRIMSIHKSKGLEFPVVILADLRRRFNREDTKKQVLIHPQLGVGLYRRDLKRMVEFNTLPRLALSMRIEKESLAEEMRVLYVAMTRAKEKLIMTCCEPNMQSYIKRLAGEAVYGKIAARMVTSAVSMADWVLLAAMSRPEAAPLRELSGLDVPVIETGDKSWLIHVSSGLKKGEETDIGKTGEDTSRPDQEDVSEEAKEEHAGEGREERLIRYITESLNFSYPYPAAPDMPSKLTATQLKGRFLDSETAEYTGLEAEAPPEERHETEAPVGSLKPAVRPDFAKEKKGLTAAERGTAVHIAMQYIDYERCFAEGDVEGELARLKDEGYLSAAQAEAVDAALIRRFFTSELAKRMMSSKDIKREFKFSILVDSARFEELGGTPGEDILFQGVIDCFFEEDGGLVILDYKTTFASPGMEKDIAEEYRTQVESYSYALERITKKRVKGKIIYFFATGAWVDLD